jgi:hypothetical protein
MGIPKSIPKGTFLCCEGVLEQANLPSLSKLIKTDWMAFWSLGQYTFAVGDQETFIRLGFRQQHLGKPDLSGKPPGDNLIFPNRLLLQLGIERLELTISKLPPLSITDQGPRLRAFSNLHDVHGPIPPPEGPSFGPSSPTLSKDLSDHSPTLSSYESEFLTDTGINSYNSNPSSSRSSPIHLLSAPLSPVPNQWNGVEKDTQGSNAQAFSSFPLNQVSPSSRSLNMHVEVMSRLPQQGSPTQADFSPPLNQPSPPVPLPPNTQVDRQMDLKPSSSSGLIEDSSPLILPPISASAFNTVNGFLKTYPKDLITLCGRLCASPSTDHITDIISGDFAFLWWRDSWIIMLGFESSFSSLHPLLHTIPSTGESPHWIPPPTAMEIALGKHLLHTTLEVYPDYSSDQPEFSGTVVSPDTVVSTKESFFESCGLTTCLEFQPPNPLPPISGLSS